MTAEVLRLKKSNCRNCYKCIRHCPVKAIRFSGNQAHIVANECILCGECFVVCPQDAKEIVDETERARVLIQSGAPVIASIAPSFIANYPGVGIRGMRKALRQLGFTDAEETAVGATIVKQEYDRLLKEGSRDILISSCCHSVNLLIRKHYPEMLSYLADVKTPMMAHCQDIKRRMPEAKTVFIGPCVAKKDEAENSGGIVDAALTYEELSRWLRKEQIALEGDLDQDPCTKTRLFPVAGGIIRTMDQDAPGFTYLAVDGAANCIAALKDIREGRIHKCFIEMSACAGGCVRGPVMEKYHPSPVRDYLAVDRYAGPKDFPVYRYEPSAIHERYLPIAQELKQPDEEEIRCVLRQMGKAKPEDELNCGSCGYDSCRAKAVGVYQGKAEVTMCLPFLMDKAERFSDTLLNNTPNGILVLNEKLEVQQINQAACRIVNVRRESDVLGEPVERILDARDFARARDQAPQVYHDKKYLAEYGRYVEETVTYDPDYRILVCIMRDFTQEEEEEQRKSALARETVEVANQVVERQMRAAQDIASLLGETTAETKVALTKLKDTISHE